MEKTVAKVSWASIFDKGWQCFGRNIILNIINNKKIINRLKYFIDFQKDIWVDDKLQILNTLNIYIENIWCRLKLPQVANSCLKLLLVASSC